MPPRPMTSPAWPKLELVSAGARCPNCSQEFGYFAKTAYVISCGHSICLGCATDAREPSCSICGINFDPQAAVRLINFSEDEGLGSDETITLAPDEQARGLHLEVALINETSGIERIRRLYTSATQFLDFQPRRLFRELHVSVTLLGCLLRTQEMVIYQQGIINSLTERMNPSALNRGSDNILAATGSCSSSSRLPASQHSNPDIMPPPLRVEIPSFQLPFPTNLNPSSAFPANDSHIPHSHNIGFMHSSTPAFLIPSNTVNFQDDHNPMDDNDHDVSREISLLDLPIPPTMVASSGVVSESQVVESIPSPVPFRVIPLPDESFSFSAGVGGELDAEIVLFGGERRTSLGELGVQGEAGREREERSALLSPNKPVDLDRQRMSVGRLYHPRPGYVLPQIAYSTSTPRSANVNESGEEDASDLNNISAHHGGMLGLSESGLGLGDINEFTTGQHEVLDDTDVESTQETPRQLAYRTSTVSGSHRANARQLQLGYEADSEQDASASSSPTTTTGSDIVQRRARAREAAMLSNLKEMQEMLLPLATNPNLNSTKPGSYEHNRDGAGPANAADVRDDEIDESGEIIGSGIKRHLLNTISEEDSVDGVGDRLDALPRTGTATPVAACSCAQCRSLGYPSSYSARPLRVDDGSIRYALEDATVYGSGDLGLNLATPTATATTVNLELASGQDLDRTMPTSLLPADVASSSIIPFPANDDDDNELDSMASFYVSEEHDQHQDRLDVRLEDREPGAELGLSANLPGPNPSLPVQVPPRPNPNLPFPTAIQSPAEVNPTQVINDTEGQGKRKKNIPASTSQPEKTTKLLCMSEDIGVRLIEATAELYHSLVSSDGQPGFEAAGEIHEAMDDPGLVVLSALQVYYTRRGRRH